MKTKSAKPVSYTENPFLYQPFNLRQFRKHRGCQRTVDFDAANNCLYVTTMKAMNFQDNIPSTPIDSFKNHKALFFELSSMQDATGDGHYPELIGEPLRRQLFFLLQNTLLNSLHGENECLRFQLSSLALLERT